LAFSNFTSDNFFLAGEVLEFKLNHFFAKEVIVLKTQFWTLLIVEKKEQKHRGSV
jgi:hypothetical protein